jgi:hypothetical protein
LPAFCAQLAALLGGITVWACAVTAADKAITSAVSGDERGG